MKRNFLFDVFVLIEFKNKNSYIDLIKKQFPEALHDEQEPEFVFVFGGDGTFLASLKHYAFLNVKLILIKEGKLGFLASVEKVDNLTIEHLRSKHFVNYDLLEVKNKREKLYAINEISLSTYFTNIFELSVNSKKFYDFKGSGFSITSATGSTGLNRSNFGPLLINDELGLIFSELSPINYKNMRPLVQDLVFTKKMKLTIKFTNWKNKLQLVLDNIEQDLKAELLVVQLVNSKAKVYDFMNLDFRIKKIKELIL